MVYLSLLMFSYATGGLSCPIYAVIIILVYTQRQNNPLAQPARTKITGVIDSRLICLCVNFSCCCYFKEKCIYKKVDKSVIEDMTSLKRYGVSILDIPLGHLLSLLGTKGEQYDWLMDVLEHPKKRERILRE